MILEVTKRCNMHCPVCFASAGECLENGDLSIDEIEKQYDFLMDHGGPLYNMKSTFFISGYYNHDDLYRLGTTFQTKERITRLGIRRLRTTTGS